MDRLNKALNRRIIRSIYQCPYKPYLDRFIPRRRESNLDLAHQQLIRNCSRELPANHVNYSDVTGHWRVECKSAKEDCQQETGLEVEDKKILIFSPKPQRYPGIDSVCICSPTANRKRPNIRRSLPGSAESVFDLPNLIYDPYRNLVDWGRRDYLSVGLSDGVHSKSMITGEKLSLETSGTVICLVWDPDGRQLAIGTDLGEILIWNAVTDTSVILEKLTRCKSDRVAAIQWNSGGTVLYGLHTSGFLRVKNIFTWKHECYKVPLKQEPVNCKLHSDDKKMAISTKSGQIVVWNVDERKPVRSMDAHNDPVKALEWVPWKIQLLISACTGSEGCIKLWNINSGEVLCTVQTNSPVYSLVINETYRELITGHSNGELRFWLLPTLRAVASKPAHDGKVFQVVLSPDRSTLASLGTDECLMLWNCFTSATSYSSPASKLQLGITQGTIHKPSGWSSAILSTLR